MIGSELKEVIADLRLSQADFARLLGVSVGAVSQWLSDTRSIPGPVEAFVGLFMRLPLQQREMELAQLRKGDAMRNGMYLVSFTGVAGQGYATLTLADGIVYGFDQAGALYDGTVQFPAEENGLAVVDIKVRMPAHVASVIGGITHPFEWILPVKTKINLQMEQGSILLETGLGGSVRVAFKRVRDLPIAA